MLRINIASDAGSIDNRDGAGIISKTCNFWRHSTVPTHDDNRPCQGAAVTEGVDYAPWIPLSYEDVSEEVCHLGQHHNH